MEKHVLGLVGGIASGKSSVAALFSRERRCLCLDADKVAGRVLAGKKMQKQLLREFPAAAGEDKSLDRALLARIVFRDASRLRVLESLTHPPIRRALRRAIDSAGERLVILDAPLLQETGCAAWCSAVVYVACPARTRRSRSRRHRGWSDAEHRAREANQWNCARKRARAHHVIDNGDGVEKARRGVRRVLRILDKGSRKA